MVVLRCDNGVLHSRLTERYVSVLSPYPPFQTLKIRKLTDSNYPPAKLEENMTAEIMQTCLTESRESYAEEIIVELQSDGEGDAEVEENVRRIAEWCEKWRQDRLAGNHDE